MRSFRREHLAQRRLDLARLVDADADVAVGLGELDEVGQRVHVAVRVAAAVVDLLPLPHHAEVAVVERDDLDRRLVLQAGRELLDAHLDRALAGDADDLGLGLGELDPHRVRQADAHRAEAAGVDPAARLLEAVVLRRPHLVLADVGGDVGLAVLGQLPERLDDVLRLDHVAGALRVGQAVLLAPLVDLRPPRRERLDVGLGRRLADLRDQLLQHVLDVADDRHVDPDALGDRRRVDVDVDDLALDRREVLRVADDAVVEAGADGEQDVAVLHRHVRFVGAVHAEHAEELRVARRIARPGPSACWCTGSRAGRRARAARPRRCRGRRRRRCRCTGRLAASSSCAAFRIWPPWPFFTGLYERISTLAG